VVPEVAGAEPVRGRSWWRFLAGFALVVTVLMATASIDATGRLGLPILAAVFGAALVVERGLYGTGVGAASRLLGFGRPRIRALVVAVLVAAVIQLVYPLLTATTGAVARLRPGWPWLLVGIFAFHGLAEELVWRGYAYRRLRVGRGFGAAVLWTMPLVAATHLPIFVTSGPAVGVAAMAVAAVTTLPLARLFDAGRGTLWAPAVLHVGIDSFKLVEVPAAVLTTFSLLLAGMSLVVPLVVLVVPRRFLEAR
jgi:membrane protease YdiL (CAAX protease family)